MKKNFNWNIYLENYPDLKHSGIDSEIKAWNHYRHFGIHENRTDKKIENNFKFKFIELYDRPDRLGANITCYIAQILYAHYNNISIKLTKNYNYSDSPFVGYLFEWIALYNSQFHREETKIEYGNTYDFTGLIGETTSTIKSDHISYFKKHIICCFKISYPISFDISKSILVHLRLDDVSQQPDYDGSVCTEFYKDLVENGKYCFYTNTFGCTFGCNLYGNKQAPISKTKLENVINQAKEKYPDYTIRIVTNPNEKVDYDYPIIQSNDENYDLYLLTKAPVVILSRSTFSLSALFFGNHETVYIPSWGHSVCMGLNTKFDNNNFNYFV